jgi:hypothetical protein
MKKIDKKSLPEQTQFNLWATGELKKLFTKAKQKWNMPPAVVADTLFTSLLICCKVDKVDPQQLENLELANAIRRERCLDKRMEEIVSFMQRAAERDGLCLDRTLIDEGMADPAATAKT